MVRDFDIVIPVNQLAVPAGITTVSPGDARVTAAATSTKAGLAAGTVALSASLAGRMNAQARATPRKPCRVNWRSSLQFERGFPT